MDTLVPSAAADIDSCLYCAWDLPAAGPVDEWAAESEAEQRGGSTVASVAGIWTERLAIATEAAGEADEGEEFEERSVPVHFAVAVRSLIPAL